MGKYYHPIEIRTELCNGRMKCMRICPTQAIRVRNGKTKVAEVDFKQKGDEVVEYVRTNPGKAILIALAVGFLVGYATRPRD